MRTLGIILVIALWILFGWKTYTDWGTCCPHNQVAEGSESLISTPGVENPDDESTYSVDDGLGSSVGASQAPVTFLWNGDEPVFSSEWPVVKEALIGRQTDGQILQITGFYHPEESNSSSAENLGLARAEALKSILEAELPTLNFEMLGRLGDDIPLNAPSFNAASFEWIDAEAEEEKIVNIGNRIDIYFPFNSTERIVDPDIESYLDQLSERLKTTSEKVILTGHTDNTGEVEVNRLLGLSRANIIKNYLVQQGIAASRITAISQGERQPVASNATSEGRAKNRRTELQIVP